MHWKLKLTIHGFLTKQFCSRKGQQVISRAAQKIPLIFFEYFLKYNTLFSHFLTKKKYDWLPKIFICLSWGHG